MLAPAARALFQDEEKRKASKLVGHKPGADVWGEAAEEQQLDQQKVLEALRRQEEVSGVLWVCLLSCR